MYITAALFASLATLAVARLSCKVPSLGGGRDDGPAINAAFQRCAKNGKITLDKYYLVDSLLLTTELDDVEIELSGMRESYLVIDNIQYF
jgi:galacturan 1,4-alpha-galacturonidase